MKPQQQPAPVQTRTFYSRARNLVVSISIGRAVIQNGIATRTDQKVAQFEPFGEEPFGVLTTSDPEVIAKLDNHPDVLTPEQYEEASVPAEMRLRMKSQRAEELTVEVEAKNREISEHNRLLEYLKQANPKMYDEAVAALKK
jgi:hypothetical protein